MLRCELRAKNVLTVVELRDLGPQVGRMKISYMTTLDHSIGNKRADQSDRTSCSQRSLRQLAKLGLGEHVVQVVDFRDLYAYPFLRLERGVFGRMPSMNPVGQQRFRIEH